MDLINHIIGTSLPSHFPFGSGGLHYKLRKPVKQIRTVQKANPREAVPSASAV